MVVGAVLFSFITLVAKQHQMPPDYVPVTVQFSAARVISCGVEIIDKKHENQIIAQPHGPGATKAMAVGAPL